MSGNHHKIVVSNYFDYNLPVFELAPATINGTKYTEVVLDSCKLMNNINNVTYNDNMIQWIRKVQISSDVQNPYFSSNAPKNEYHLCTLFLEPGYYETIDSVIVGMNKQLKTLKELLFPKISVYESKIFNVYAGEIANSMLINLSNQFLSNLIISQITPVGTTVSLSDLVERLNMNLESVIIDINSSSSDWNCLFSSTNVWNYLMFAYPKFLLSKHNGQQIFTDETWQHSEFEFLISSKDKTINYTFRTPLQLLVESNRTIDETNYKSSLSFANVPTTDVVPFYFHRTLTNLNQNSITLHSDLLDSDIYTISTDGFIEKFMRYNKAAPIKVSVLYEEAGDFNVSESKINEDTEFYERYDSFNKYLQQYNTYVEASSIINNNLYRNTYELAAVSNESIKNHLSGKLDYKFANYDNSSSLTSDDANQLLSSNMPMLTLIDKNDDDIKTLVRELQDASATSILATLPTLQNLYEEGVDSILQQIFQILDLESNTEIFHFQNSERVDVQTYLGLGIVNWIINILTYAYTSSNAYEYRPNHENIEKDEYFKAFVSDEFATANLVRNNNNESTSTVVANYLFGLDRFGNQVKFMLSSAKPNVLFNTTNTAHLSGAFNMEKDEFLTNDIIEIILKHMKSLGFYELNADVLYNIASGKKYFTDDNTGILNPDFNEMFTNANITNETVKNNVKEHYSDTIDTNEYFPNLEYIARRWLNRLVNAFIVSQ